MNLDNLKPAWRKFQLVNSMPSMDQEEILLMLESVESVPLCGTHRVLINILLFIVFTFCFQGG